MPESRNMFAMNTGSGSARGMLVLVVMIIALGASIPAFVLTFFVPGWAMLVIGAAYGTGLAVLGCVVGGRRLARRGPELLLAVTPRR
jgi:ABC-2 type transport system permease protein